MVTLTKIGIDTRQFIAVVVRPLIDRLEKEGDAVDLQIGAAIVTFHIADYIRFEFAKYGVGTIKIVRTRISSLIENYDVLDHVANSSKHARGGRNTLFDGKPTPDTLSSGKSLLVTKRDGKPSFLRLPGGSLISTKQTARFVLDDGRKIPILRLIKDALNASERVLAECENARELAVAPG